jgi:cobalt-zinc-cadmium efflux system membrane fusion protein
MNTRLFLISLALAVLPPAIIAAAAAEPATRPATTPAAEPVVESDPVKLTPAALERFGVKVQPATTQPLTGSFSAPARVSLNLEATAQVGSPVSGRVIETRVRAGDAVAKGDVLLVIESPELGEAQSDYLQKRTELVVAGSNLEVSRTSFERARQLQERSEGIALAEVLKREGELRGAEGAQKAASAAVASAANRLKLLGMNPEAIAGLEGKGIDTRYEVRSPLAGQVIERSITLGELVKPERESLLMVADMSTLWVLVDVPESLLDQVGRGSTVRIRFPALRGRNVEGVVSYIAPRLDEATRTVPVRVEIKPGDLTVLPGMFAEAEVFAPTAGAAVLGVPDTAVQTIDGFPAVFVPVRGVPGAFVARRVRLGPSVGGIVPVFAGLREGEPFVVAGSFILKAELGKGAVQEE